MLKRALLQLAVLCLKRSYLKKIVITVLKFSNYPNFLLAGLDFVQIIDALLYLKPVGICNTLQITISEIRNRNFIIINNESKFLGNSKVYIHLSYKTECPTILYPPSFSCISKLI